MRLIDADALKVDYIVPSTTTNTACYPYVSYFQIKDAPTVDAVEVVRCEDCRFCGYDKMFDEMWCNGKRVSADWFCANGERRENDKSIRA